MTTSAILALRRAILPLLVGDAGLVAALGGPDVFDEVPAGAVLPYVTFGDALMRDWSTGSDLAVEQMCVLDVWSQQRGLREALSIASRISDLLDGARPTLDGWRLVNLRLVASETRREANGRFARASLRFRAALERI